MAFEFAIASVVISILITWVVLEWEWRDIVKLCAVVGSIPFLMIAWEKFTSLSAHQHQALASKLEAQAKQKKHLHEMAVMQAELEKLLGEDLNNSGAIGDVVDEPVEKIQHHFINTNAMPTQHVITIGESELDLNHFIEFVKKQEERKTIRREDWLGSKRENTQPFIFSDGATINREEYDLCMKVLDERARALKGAGTARRVIYSASQILQYLGMNEKEIS